MVDPPTAIKHEKKKDAELDAEGKKETAMIQNDLLISENNLIFNYLNMFTLKCGFRFWTILLS